MKISQKPAYDFAKLAVKCNDTVVEIINVNEEDYEVLLILIADVLLEFRDVFQSLNQMKA